jgi:hypothetical protein
MTESEDEIAPPKPKEINPDKERLLQTRYLQFIELNYQKQKLRLQKQQALLEARQKRHAEKQVEIEKKKKKQSKWKLFLISKKIKQETIFDKI